MRSVTLTVVVVEPTAAQPNSGGPVLQKSVWHATSPGASPAATEPPTGTQPPHGDDVLLALKMQRPAGACASTSATQPDARPPAWVTKQRRPGAGEGDAVEPTERIRVREAAVVGEEGREPDVVGAALGVSVALPRPDPVALLGMPPLVAPPLGVPPLVAPPLGVPPLGVPTLVALPLGVAPRDADATADGLRRLATLTPRYVRRASTLAGVSPPPPLPAPPPAASHSSTDSRSPLT
jgi:hypothetical protein